MRLGKEHEGIGRQGSWVERHTELQLDLERGVMAETRNCRGRDRESQAIDGRDRGSASFLEQARSD